MLCPHLNCVLFCIISYRFVVSIKNLDLDWPIWGYRLAPFHLEIWTGTTMQLGCGLAQTLCTVRCAPPHDPRLLMLSNLEIHAPPHAIALEGLADAIRSGDRTTAILISPKQRGIKLATEPCLLGYPRHTGSLQKHKKTAALKFRNVVQAKSPKPATKTTDSKPLEAKHTAVASTQGFACRSCMHPTQLQSFLTTRERHDQKPRALNEPPTQHCRTRLTVQRWNLRALVPSMHQRNT